MANETIGDEGAKDKAAEKVLTLKPPKAKEPVKEPEQDTSPEDEEARDGDGDIFKWELELSGVAGILEFMEEVFNVVGDGSLEFTTSYGFAVGDLMRLCAKRLRLIQP